MKRFFRIFSIFMICATLLPIFVACQGEGNSELKGVKFSQSVYEVDIDLPTELSYKVYPSTATSNNIRFAFDGDEEKDYENKYSFKNGKITILEECGDITVTIISGDYSDNCTVRLKNYPTTLNFQKNSYLLNRGNALSLSLIGMVAGVDAQIDANEYTIEVESSNQSVVRVEDGLNVFSTGKTGSATISAYIKNRSGKYATEYNNHFEDKKTKEGVLVAQTTVTIVDNIENAYLNISGADSFMQLTNNSQKTDSNSYTTALTTLKFSFVFYSNDGYYISPDDVELLIISNNPDVGDVLSDGNGYIKDADNNYQLQFKLNGQFIRIEVHTNLVDSYGKPIEYKFYVQKNV